MERRFVDSQEGYAARSKDYDAYENPLVAVEEAPVRQLLGPVQGLRVLDLGCGTGRHAIWLHQQGAEVVGIDASEEMLTRARRKQPRLDLRRRDALAPGDDLGEFDLVLKRLPRPAMP